MPVTGLTELYAAIDRITEAGVQAAKSVVATGAAKGFKEGGEVRAVDTRGAADLQRRREFSAGDEAAKAALGNREIVSGLIEREQGTDRRDWTSCRGGRF